MREVVLKYDYKFKGEMSVGDFTTKVGAGTLLPYDLVYGALGSCLYATFLDIIVKKRIEIESCEIVVSGIKRTEIPTTMETCNLVMKVSKPSKEQGLLEAFDLACKYCSVFYTLSQVGKIDARLEIEA